MRDAALDLDWLATTYGVRFSDTPEHIDGQLASVFRFRDELTGRDVVIRALDPPHRAGTPGRIRQGLARQLTSNRPGRLTRDDSANHPIELALHVFEM